MKKFGIIGYPVKGSLSPKLFEAAYNGKYEYHTIEDKEFENVFSIFLNEYAAINVTSPFKLNAYNSADILSKECKITSAANILVKKNGKIEAYNSDISGVLYCLEKCKKHSNGLIGKKSKVLVIGCGGAGRAAAYAALLFEMDISLINRTYEKALKLKEKLQSIDEGKSTTIEAYPFDKLQEEVDKNDMIIYNLPLKIDLLDNLKFEGKKYIIEAKYSEPAFAEIIKKYKENIIYLSGEDWLIGQGIAGYKIMTGEEPNIEAMLKVI